MDFGLSRIHRGGAEFAEKSWGEDSTGLGFGFHSKADFLCVLCVSAVNRYLRLWGRELGVLDLLRRVEGPGGAAGSRMILR